jgi:hypothetical protein
MSDKKYVIEVQAAGAPEAVKNLNAVADAEHRIADVRAPKDGTPFDAVAKAAPAAAAKAQAAAQAISTSFAKIAGGEASNSQLRAAEETIALDRSTRVFQRRLGLSQEQARALAQAKLNERREDRGKEALGAVGTLGLGQIGDALGFGGQAIGRVGRLALGATAAVSIAEKVGEMRRETRLFSEAQTDAARAFERGTHGAGPKQLIANVESESARIRLEQRARNEQLNPRAAESPMKWAATKLRDGLDFIGITPERQKSSDIEFSARRKQMDFAADKAIRLGAEEQKATQLAADGHLREADAIRRKASFMQEVEGLMHTEGISNEKKQIIGRQMLAGHEAQEQAIKEKNAEADAKSARALDTQLAVQQELSIGHERSAAAIQRKAAMEEQVRDIEGNKDLPDREERAAAVRKTWATGEQRIERDNSEADASALAARQAAVLSGSLQAGGLEVMAGQLERQLALTREIDAINKSDMSAQDKKAALMLAGQQSAQAEVAAAGARQRAVEQTLHAMEAEAQISAMTAAGDGIGVQHARERLALEQQIAGIKANPNLTPGQRESEIAAAQKLAVQQSLTREKERRELVAASLRDAQARARIDEAEAAGNRELAQKLSVQKELADRILEITNQVRSGALTEGEGEQLKGLAERDAKAKQFGQDRAKLNADVETDIAQARETPRQRDARREAEKRAASDERAERARVLSRREAQAREDEGFGKLASAEQEKRRAEWADEYNKKRGLDDKGGRLDDAHRRPDRPEDDIGRDKPGGKKTPRAPGADPAKPGAAEENPLIPDAGHPVPPPAVEQPSQTDAAHLDVSPVEQAVQQGSQQMAQGLQQVQAAITAGSAEVSAAAASLGAAAQAGFSAISSRLAAAEAAIESLAQG